MRLPANRILLVLPVLLAVLVPVRASAQDDPNDMPLGDFARTLRKKNPPAQPVIDDDNLPQVMEQVESRRSPGSALRFLMAGAGKIFQISAPDVTCSLSFTPKVKSLLSRQYSQMDLPDDLVSKVQGKATIEGDALTIPVFNGTDWHVSELDVALTVVRKPGSRSPFEIGEPLVGGDEDGVSSMGADPLQQVRPEKKPDVTVIYRMRTASPPWERAIFSAPLDFDLSPGDEWHWAIVQAKGYPPESYAGTSIQTATKKNDQQDPRSPVAPALAGPETPPAATLAQAPQ
ncbi:MAG TPA: hypothetical protein VKQ11_03440 [Candidatus Sulfotelmatobacter sp.]|nr:hypothetical protein [Candidatus Sulfotelmatobacter sp.]